jgi:hypothetical protein
MEHLRVKNSGRVCFDELNESSKKMLRSATSCPYKYFVPSPDVPEYSLLRDKLFRILFLDLVKPGAAFMKTHFDLLPEYLNKFFPKSWRNFFVDKKFAYCML